MHNCQQYIKFLLKSAKKSKIFGDNLPYHITIHSYMILFALMFILIILMPVTDTICVTQICNLPHLKQLGATSIIDREKCFKKDNLILWYDMEQQNTERLIDNRGVTISKNEFPLLNKIQQIKEIHKKSSKCFICDIRKFDKILKQPNKCVCIHKILFCNLHTHESIVRLLQKCTIVKVVNLRNQYVKSHGDSKYRPRKLRCHLKGASRIKRNDIMQSPGASNNGYQPNEAVTLATTSM